MISNIIFGLGGILHNLVTIYIWVVIIASLLTWIKPDPNNPIVQLLYRITEPAYALVRRYIPSVYNGVDLSPLVIIIGLQIIDVLLVSVINSIASVV
jgi:YggT family protein